MSTSKSPLSLEPDERVGVEDLFSRVPEHRVVEVAFLQRLVAAFGASRSEAYTDSAGPHGTVLSSHEAQLALIRSPLFSKLARQLEKSIPDDP